MAIFNNFQINNRNFFPKQKPGKTAFLHPFSLTQRGLNCDTFVKSASNKDLKGVEDSLWNEERLRKIYDEVYSEVVEQNPIIKELNIQKPVFIFKQTPEDNSKRINFASYSFLNNSIELTSNLYEDMYAIGIKDQNGDMAELIDVAVQTVLDEDFEKSKKLEPNLVAVKLTDSEKEFRIKGIIAHELRHWIQEHILISTEDTMKSYKEYMQKICSKIDNVLDGVDISQIPEQERLLIDTSYFKNYKPKKVLKEKHLKLSRLPKDRRHWSLENHILKSATDEKYHSNYFAMPNEADANYYAFEYLVSKMPKTYSNDMRKDIITSIIIYYENEADTAINDMEKGGYPPIVTL